MTKRAKGILLLIPYFLFTTVYALWLTGNYKWFFDLRGQRWQDEYELKVIGMKPSKLRPTPLVTPSPTPIPYGKPTQIVIEKIGVDAAVEEVGLVPGTEQMDVPKDVAKVGWYNQGPVPGEEGSSVLTAHYDTPTGAPAVFNKLRNMSKGDEFYIVDTKKNKIEYIVREVKDMPVSTFPMELIFRDAGYSKLSLITCSGVWNPITRDYSKRLVVISTLKSVSNYNTVVADAKVPEVNLSEVMPVDSQPGSGSNSISIGPDTDGYLPVFIETNARGARAVDVYISSSDSINKSDITITPLFKSYSVDHVSSNIIRAQLFQPQDFPSVNSAGKKKMILKIARIGNKIDNKITLSFSYPYTSKVYSDDDLPGK